MYIGITIKNPFIMELKTYKAVNLALSFNLVSYKQVKDLLISDLELFENELNLGEFFNQELYEFLCKFYELKGNNLEENKNQFFDILNAFLVTPIDQP